MSTDTWKKCRNSLKMLDILFRHGLNANGYFTKKSYAFYDYALIVAEEALRVERCAGREPDRRTWQALSAMRRWLSGDITNMEMYEIVDGLHGVIDSTAHPAAVSAVWAVFYACFPGHIDSAYGAAVEATKNAILSAMQSAYQWNFVEDTAAEWVSAQQADLLRRLIK